MSKMQSRKEWVVCGIERDTDKCFIKFVHKRDKDTLIPLIKSHVLPKVLLSDDLKMHGLKSITRLTS